MFKKSRKSEILLFSCLKLVELFFEEVLGRYHFCSFNLIVRNSMEDDRRRPFNECRESKTCMLVFSAGLFRAWMDWKDPSVLHLSPGLSDAHWVRLSFGNNRIIATDKQTHSLTNETQRSTTFQMGKIGTARSHHQNTNCVIIHLRCFSPFRPKGLILALIIRPTERNLVVHEEPHNAGSAYNSPIREFGCPFDHSRPFSIAADNVDIAVAQFSKKKILFRKKFFSSVINSKFQHGSCVNANSPPTTPRCGRN